MWSRRASTLCVGAVLVGLLAACTVGPSSRPELAVFGAPTAADATDSTAATTDGPGGPGRQAQFDPGWGTCRHLVPATGAAADFAMSCANLPVPVDYTNAGGTTLNLAVGRATAPGLAADAPALVVLMGNGAFEADLANVDRLQSIAATLPAEITGHFQIVGIDVRGSGSSVKAACFQDYPVEYLFTLSADPSSSAGGMAQLTDVTRAFTFGCQDYMGPESVFFGTTQVADDLDSLRSALGIDTLDFVGVGYGGTVGAVYAHRYPRRVGRMVLDSPIDHAGSPADRAVTSALGFERQLVAFTADCAVREDCPMRADFDGLLSTALARLRYDSADRADDWYLGSSSVLWALTMALPEPARWPELAQAIADAAAGRTGTLAGLLDSLQRDPAALLSTRLVLDCNDSDERLADADLTQRLDSAEASAPTFGPFLVSIASLCRNWPAPEAPLGPLRAQEAAPIVMIAGVADPVAPYAGVQALANQLTSAVLISYQGLTHGGYPTSQCLADAVDRYLLTGALPTAGTLCTS